MWSYLKAKVAFLAGWFASLFGSNKPALAPDLHLNETWMFQPANNDLALVAKVKAALKELDTGKSEGPTESKVMCEVYTEDFKAIVTVASFKSSCSRLKDNSDGGQFTPTVITMWKQ